MRHRISNIFLVSLGGISSLGIVCFAYAPPQELLVSEFQRSWKSTKDVDQRRISLAVARTLSSIQHIAVSNDTDQPMDESKKRRLCRATGYVAGSFFVTLMLKHASSESSSEAFREETSSYIASVMKDSRAASSFLSTSGNATLLFQALDRDKVLSERVWDSMKDIDDVHVLLASEKDFDIVVSNMGRYRQKEFKRRISLRMFRWWCQHSDFQFRDKDVLKAIDCLSTASNAVSSSDTSSKFDIVRSMRYMIEHMNTEFVNRRHHTLPWLWPLLCFAADGVASHGWDLVNESLDAFTSCIERKVLPGSHMIESSALPLLFTLSRGVPVNRLDVDVRIAECISALSRSNLIQDRLKKKQWAELFSAWLVRLDPRQEDLLSNSTTQIEAKALSESLVDALASLSADDDNSSLQIANLWLAEMIVHLSRMAKPYSSVDADEQVREGKADDTRASWTSPSWWWSWMPYLYPRSSAKQSPDEVLEQSEDSLGVSQNDSMERLTGKSNPSDSELSLYINASPIGPVFARSVAGRLLEVSGNVVPNIENADLENMSPLTAASYSAAAATVNRQVADDTMAQALKVAAALASSSSDNRRWLLLAGLPQMLRLVIEKRKDSMTTKLERQISRLLSLLSIEISGAESLVRNKFVPWLQFLASSEDCKVSSNAAKALLHVEAARESGLLLNSDNLSNYNRNLLDPSRRINELKGKMTTKEHSIKIPRTDQNQNHHIGYELMTLDLKKKRALFAKQKRADTIWRNLRETRLVLHDGVHLLCPLAQHHEVLAQKGSLADSLDGAPDIDIVFVHGIRGGAFITWRQEQAFTRGGARGNVDHSVCWPAAWLAPIFPSARMITAEYAAPATWWEGESLPLYAMVNNMAERLAAAGIGSRPVVFVCHSMGGLIIKEIIGRGTERDAPESLRRISEAAVGAVFYSVPHAGSRLADFGWTLRYLGASPSRAVAHLKTDPHLHEMNSVIRDLCKRDKLRVLSFSEGLPTKLSYVYTHVVPHESAYPGYGDFKVLADHDHITACKPKDTQDPAFRDLVDFLSRLKKDIIDE
jgi:hypothetical protein